MGLTFLDYFAGVGGFRRGMEMAGHICLGHCEIDKFANMSYTEIHEPKEEEWFGTDIRRTNADELPRADVWCFGFPCQDISSRQENSSASKVNVQVYFSQLQDLLGIQKKKIDPSIYLLRTLKTYLVLMEDATSLNFSLSWMKSGMMQNGKFSILKTSEFHKIGKECSLSDILEEEVDEKYFLSEEITKRLVLKN